MRGLLILLAIVLVILLLIGSLSCYVTQPVRSSSEALPSAVSAERLERRTRTLSSDFLPRDFAHPENLDRAAAWIRREFEKTGGPVSEQPFEAWGNSYRNVIVSFGPRSGERIIVGAHYDAAGEFPGADDNASGVAGLLELADLLAAEAPARRVDLVAYSVEEPPMFRTHHMGSVVHARALRHERVPVRAMISLEMIGYFTDAPRSQAFPLAVLRLFYPSEGNFITVVGRFGGGSLVRRIKRAMRGASPLPVYSINAPRSIPGVDFSDHASYWDTGYPAVMITDTAFYRNPNYHTIDDTPETLDYQRMAWVVGGVHAAVLDLANGERN